MLDKKYQIGFAFGIFVALLIGGFPFLANVRAISELEAELDRSYQFVREVRDQNQKLSFGQQQLTSDLERANLTVIELTERSQRAEQIVESTSRELALAITESRDLGGLLRGILEVIEQIELRTQVP